MSPVSIQKNSRRSIIQAVFICEVEDHKKVARPIEDWMALHHGNDGDNYTRWEWWIPQTMDPPVLKGTVRADVEALYKIP